MVDRGSELGPFQGLGQALQFLRSERGLTQPALSVATRRLDRGRAVSKTSISGYERGHSTPTLAVLGKLLDAMEVDLAEFAEVLSRIHEHTPVSRRAVRRPPRPAHPSDRGRAAAERATAGLPAYLVVDLREAQAQGIEAAPAHQRQMVALVELARGLAGQGRAGKLGETRQPASSSARGEGEE